MIKRISNPVIFLCLFSCKYSVYTENKLFKITEKPINTSGIIEYKKNIDYSNRFGYVAIGANQYLTNITKDQHLIMCNLADGKVITHELNVDLPSSRIEATYYDNDALYFIKKKSIFRFNYEKKTTDSLFEIPLSGSEFIIHNMYATALFKYKDKFYVQYGNASMYNRIDTSSVLIFDRLNSEKKFIYPFHFSQYYVHYNDICISRNHDTFYYTFATYPEIYRATKDERYYKSVLFDSVGFLKYDTSRMTDMKYIYDYTMATVYNIKLLAASKYIFLIQRIPHSNIGNFKLIVFNHNLDIIYNKKITHPIDANFIFLEGEDLVFLSLKEKKSYNYAFE